MAFKKPSVKKTVQSLDSLRIYLRSVKKFGKSTLFRDTVLEEYGDAEKGLLVGVGAEMGYTLLDELNTTHVMTWKDMEELKKWLITEKGKEHDIKLVAFDVIDELIPIIEKEVCRLSMVETGKSCKSINQAFGGYGKGQERAKELAKQYFFELYASGFGVWAISHTKTKNIVEKGMEETEGYTILTSNLSNSYEGIFGDIFDCVLTGMIDRDVVDGKTQNITRKLYLRGTHYVDAGCRFAMDSVPEFIVFDKVNNAPEFVKVLKDGMAKSKRTKTTTVNKVEKEVVEEVKEEIKEVAKEIPKEVPQEVKEEKVVESVTDFDFEGLAEEQNEMSNEDLFKEIKPLYMKAEAEQKQQIKEIITSYGYKKFDLTAPNSMFVEVLNVLK